MDSKISLDGFRPTFFEDLKYNNASPVSEESIKRFNYSEIQIKEKNEKAKKIKYFNS